MNKWIIYVALMLFSSSFQASGSLSSFGIILSISPQSMMVSDRYYLLSSTVKVWSTDKKKISLQQLKIGDYIELDIIKLQKNKYLVDHIFKLRLDEKTNE